ncbi:hypothetical protein [Roseisolibacter agri]|uniref:Uncharacterized protein n=1 Tax=Roseisolibacter agri TaxID=2014610 RepID=A0AA37Q8A3_9BACT|nr:hypothetical protein [Roseisolibacter agri]GLC28415.1 hypothetical protein rosag_49280 [Roseisolibacter agri]
MPGRGADRRATDRDDERRAETWALGRGTAMLLAIGLAALLWLAVQLERATHVVTEAETARTVSAETTR